MSLYALPKTTQAILQCSNTLKSLNIRNAYAHELPLTTSMPSLQDLSIGYSGSQLKLDLSCFPNLQSLALSLEVHDEGSERDDDYVTTASPTILRIPPSMWSDLRTLKLDIFPWVPIDVLIQDFEQSLKGAQISPPLEDLAIFWNIPESAQLHFLRLFVSYCPNIHRLALTTWETPTVAYIHRLSSACSSHKIVQLTLCAYMPCGSWQWPETASSYGHAFSTFPYLQQLAINHNDDIESYEVDEGSTGKFTYDCSEKGAELRLAFAEEIARKCSSLQEIAFCPLEQQVSRIEIERSRPRNGPLTRVAFDHGDQRFFWHNT